MTVGYTIFNQVNLIPRIIWTVNQCFDKNDEAIFLFDNCTDGSYKKFKELSNQITVKFRVIIPKEELFEIKANNVILKEASHDTIILFQDDMICSDQLIKRNIGNIIKVFRKRGWKLGLMGGRSGYEIDGTTAFPFKSYKRVSSWEHLSVQYGESIIDGTFEIRTILNRGPLVFTREMLDEVGYLDEEYFPLHQDDADYCCRSKFKYGRKNLAFKTEITSDLKWGSTRRRKSYPIADGRTISNGRIAKRNWRLFINRWSKDLKENYENLSSDE